MKKIVCGILCMLSVLILLSGCGKNTSDENYIRVAALKGPTSMGLLNLLDLNDNGKTKNHYSFEMATQADEILPKVVSGDVDIALVPANVAAVLYNKTKGGISVIDINTLGVLYAVGSDSSVTNVTDLKGKTVYVTNKGTTPDYVFQYLLSVNGIDLSDINIEYKSEASEVAALLKEDPSAIGILPQPFVTAAVLNNESLNILLNLSDEWDRTEGNSDGRLVTGVTIVRNDFLKEYESAVRTFMEEHKASAEKAAADLDNTAKLVVSYGIIEKEPVAKKALPYCSITYIDKDEMKDALSGYLKVLYDLDPSSVGGTLPGEDFYY